VPSADKAPKLPSDALDAFLDGILLELRSPADPGILDEVRAAFRKRIPFSLRSYAAAALILRAAGFRGAPGKAVGKEGQALGVKKAPESKGAPGATSAPREGNLGDSKKKGDRPARKDATGEARDKGEARKERGEPRRRLAGEGIPLFFSMGRRQKFYPRILIDLLVESGGVKLEDIGEVRAFDNYCFADIAPAKADAVVAALDGAEFRGRKLSVSPAKKRDGIPGEEYP
jgi:hypothetical protein